MTRSDSLARWLARPIVVRNLAYAILILHALFVPNVFQGQAELTWQLLAKGWLAPKRWVDWVLVIGGISIILYGMFGPYTRVKMRVGLAGIGLLWTLFFLAVWRSQNYHNAHSPQNYRHDFILNVPLCMAVAVVEIICFAWHTSEAVPEHKENHARWCGWVNRRRAIFWSQASRPAPLGQWGFLRPCLYMLTLFVTLANPTDTHGEMPVVMLQMGLGAMFLGPVMFAIIPLAIWLMYRLILGGNTPRATHISAVLLMSIVVSSTLLGLDFYLSRESAFCSMILLIATLGIDAWCYWRTVWPNQWPLDIQRLFKWVRSLPNRGRKSDPSMDSNCKD